MALHHFQETFGKNVGAAGDVFVLAGAEVTVKDEATGTLVAIYQDVDGNTIKANPFNADGNGFAEFYVKSGRIRVTATANGQTVDLRNISLGSSIPVTTGSGADQDLGEALDQRVIYVDTLADLQALPTSELMDGQGLKITTTGRAGDFVVRVGDFSTEVTNDPVNVVWAPFNDDPTGGSVVAMRKYNMWGRLNLLWAGADPTGNTSSHAAIKGVMEYAAGRLPSGLNAPIQVPAGDFLIQESGVFSYKPSGVSAWGFSWHGDGWLQSRFILDPQTATKSWFYDSAGFGAYVGHVFNDIGFETSNLSGNQAFAYGFNIEGTSGSGVGEGAFRFNTCMIGRETPIQGWLSCTGTINSAEIKHIGCQIRQTQQYVVHQDNAQSVNIDFVSTDMLIITGDVFHIVRGGVINVFGGAIQWSSGYLFNIDNTDSNLVFVANLNGIKTELNDAAATFIKKTNIDDGTVKIVFNECDLQRGIVGGSRTLVDIRERTSVFFNQCDVQVYADSYVINHPTGSASVVPPGLIKFNECKVSDDEVFLTCISTPDTYGVASARGCYIAGAGELRKNIALDFDANYEYVVPGQRPPEIKISVLKDKRRPWPLDSTGDGVGDIQEHTLTLPEGSVIVGAVIFKPAPGGSGETHQIHIGSNDKLTTYASSASAGQGTADHVIEWNPSPAGYVHVGNDLNLRTIRLWANPAGGQTDQNLPGEIAYIKYI